VAWGTARAAATQSTLPESPGGIMDTPTHVRGLAEHFAPYATALRDAIARAAEVEDAGSTALYTDLAREVDQQLGVLEAHLHRDGVSTEPARHDGRRAE
jgi:starvation-inducible DNA-binding protein